MDYLRIMFGLSGEMTADHGGMYYLLASLILFVLSWICSTLLPFRICDRQWRKARVKPGLLLFYLGLFLASTAYLIHDTYNPFLYFRF